MNFGEAMRQRRYEAKKLADDTMQLANRYQLLVPDAVANYFRIPQGLAKSVLERLNDEGLLEKVSLYRNRRCYLVKLGEPKSSISYSENQKTRSYARLVFCLLGEGKRHKLTQNEVIQKFTNARRSENYFVDFSGKHPVMGFLRIDLAGVGRWDRIIAKALDDVRYHLAESEFQPYVSQNAFEIRIITPLEQKAEQINRRVAKESSIQAIPIKVTAVPELINLTQPLPSNRYSSH